jgi:hypothetical protein
MDLKRRLYEKQSADNQRVGGERKEQAAAIRAIPWYIWVLGVSLILIAWNLDSRLSRIERLIKHAEEMARIRSY